MNAGENEPAADTAPPTRTGPPAHSSRPLPRFDRIGAWAGGAAVLIAIGVGTTALLRSADDAPSGPRSLDAITVASEPPAVLPLSEREILALLDQRPEYGPLSDPARRTGCLAALGYSASTSVLGAREITINDRPGIVLLLPGSPEGTVRALAVAPNCSSVNTGLLAETSVRRP
ncbi:hypothetical protein [Mycolicibacter minnesotensis]